MLRRISLVLNIVLCLLCFSCKAETRSYPILFNCTERLENPYGVCSHINTKGELYEFDTREKELQMIGKCGINWVRTDFYTFLIKKTNDENLNYQHFDTMMASVHSYKKSLLGILSAPGSKNEYNDWGNYVGTTVNRYKQSVKYWEVINEANLRYKNPIWSWFKATDYADLLRISSAEIREKDGEAKILFSGIGDFDSEFVDTVFRAGAANYFDIMNVHYYHPKQYQPESFIEIYGKLHDKMVKYGIEKPVWLTECGCPTAGDKSLEHVQAQKLPRIFLISFACGVDKVFWYNFRSNEKDPNDNECHFGLCHKDYEPKPAYYAYKTLIKFCPDKASRPVLQKTGRVYIAKWQRADGKQVYGIWTSKTNEKISVTMKGRKAFYDLYGKRIRKRTKTTIDATPSILYIVGGKNFELCINE